MVICGVDIKGKEARLALVQDTGDGVTHILCSTKKLSLLDDRDRQSLINLKLAIEAFALQNYVKLFVIKARQASGLRASGGITFKIETIFQLGETPVNFVSAVALARFAKGNLGGVPSSILEYQTDAYRVAAYYHVGK